MRDSDIRLALDQHLRSLHEVPGTIIRHELGLREGHRRIDIAVINGSLSGWEIKSDVDTLARLAGQAIVYGEVLDYITIVTTSRYSSRAEEMLPNWWGVLVASFDERCGVTFRESRPSALNTRTVGMSVVQLLWREEAMAILRDRNLGRGFSGKARWYLWNELVECIPPIELRELIREKIKARQDWPGGQLQPGDDAKLRRRATA